MPLSLERHIHFSCASGSQETQQIVNSKETGLAGSLHAEIDVTRSNTNTLVPGFAAEGSQECSKAPKL